MAIRAADLGIRKLYHYENFNPDYLADTLSNQHIHFSNPQHFNDPWDCYPCMDTARASDPTYRARCIEVFRQLPNPLLTAVDRRIFEARLHQDGRLFAEMLQNEFRGGNKRHDCQVLASLLPHAVPRRRTYVVALLQSSQGHLPGIRRRRSHHWRRPSSAIRRRTPVGGYALNFPRVRRVDFH